MGWVVRQALRALWYGLLLVSQGLRQLIRLIPYLWKPGKADTHGSARFASKRQIRKLGLLRPTGLIVGEHQGRLLRYGKAAHAFTYAPTRAGKGIGAVIPNILDHPGSVVVIDIKGENAAVTRRHRSTLGPVYQFQPQNPDQSAAYNPMDFIRPDFAEDDAEALADLLVQPSGHGHFDTLSKATVMAVLLYVHHTHWSDPNGRTLSEVRRLLSLSKDEFEAFITEKLMASPITAIRNAVSNVMKAADEEFGSILSSASRDMGVWDKATVQAISCMSDIKLEALKHQTVTIYLTVSPDALGPYGPWLRVMVGQLIAAMTRDATQPKHPVLFLLDEFPALGRMSAIEKGIGYLAGYGVSLWLVTQDIHQVADIYKGERWKSLFANCTIRQCFGVNDPDSAELASRMLGTTTVQSHSEGYASDVDQWIGRRNQNQSEAGRPLMTPGEIMTMPDDRMLLFCDGWPIFAKKLDYRRMRRFRGMWDRWLM
ncbi:MAG: type IV secretory system conjugative DNA transfer family protein [Pontimonas sp.]